MRSYKQRCALAKALDVVGDRWTLLIVRELMIRGKCRYTDLRNGLPGIATNLLAERIRELEEAGIVGREEAPPPVATTLFNLTERGGALEQIVLELGRWGAPLLSEGAGDERMQAHWLVPPLKLHLVDKRPNDPPIAIEVNADDEVIAIAASGGKVEVRLGVAVRPDAVVTGKPEHLLKLFTGRLDLKGARAKGLRVQGATDLLARLIPV